MKEVDHIAFWDVFFERCLFLRRWTDNMEGADELKESHETAKRTRLKYLLSKFSSTKERKNRICFDVSVSGAGMEYWYIDFVSYAVEPST